MTTAVDGLIGWITEREAIRRKKEAGEPKPWTDDPILRAWSFCNVHREDDRVTRWIAAHWREPHDGDPDLWFAMTVARFVNWPDSLAAIGYPAPWDPERFLAVMADRKGRGEQCYSGAYRLGGNTRNGRDNPAYQASAVFAPLWRDRERLRPKAGERLAEYCGRLCRYHGMGGGFMAAQVIADLKYVEPLKSANDWWTWAASGPGSRRGMLRMLGRPLPKGDPRWRAGEYDWLTKLRELGESIAPKLEAAGIGRLHAQDVQNCLCEFDKYERVRLGEGKPRARYWPPGEGKPKQRRAAKPAAAEGATAASPVPSVTTAAAEALAAADAAVPIHEPLAPNEPAIADIVDAAAYKPHLADLADHRRWVAWRVEGSPGKKVPYNAVGSGKASSTNDATWGTRAQAEARAAGGGIGIVLGDLDEKVVLAGIDLDSCRERDTGEFAGWAATVIKRFASYTEVSPSKTGAKILFRLTAADRDAIRTEIRQARPDGDGDGIKWARGDGEHPPAIELYLGKRYFTVTENALADAPAELRLVEPETLRWLIREIGPAFVGNGPQSPRGHRTDFSRSGDAAALARRVYRAGMTFEQYVAALHDNVDTAEWARTKGSAHGNREIRRAWALVMTDPDNAPLSLDDFWAYLPQHNYIFAPTRQLWPAASVNSQLPPVPLLKADGRPVLDDKKGNPVEIPAATWLDRNKPVVQMTWEPGSPTVIEDRIMVESGWVDRPGIVVFNQYVPPAETDGNPAQADRWIKLVEYVYADAAEHIFDWLAHRVQRPFEKVNHALVLGGEPGIGKDTIVEAVADAIGRWNLQEASPDQMMTQAQNPYMKAVILRISEARDLGDADRFRFYDHLKAIIAAPPPVLTVNEKYIRQYLIPNLCGIVITTNHKTDGIYLPAEDRRHYVAWSDRHKEDQFYAGDYWPATWRWLNDKGGSAHVTAWLRRRDISGWNAKAPPPLTAAFWEIVNVNRPPEEGELADAIDEISKEEEERTVVTLEAIRSATSNSDLSEWLGDRKNRRAIPHRMEKVGYVSVRNPDRVADGDWSICGKRQVVYVRNTVAQKVEAVRKYIRTVEAKANYHAQQELPLGTRPQNGARR